MKDKDKITRNLLHTVFAGANYLSSELEQVVREYMKGSFTQDMSHAKVLYALRHEILSDETMPYLCHYLPALLADVARHELIISFNDPYTFDLLELGIKDKPNWSPPYPFQGPFLGLLRHAPRIGMKLILELTNHATQAWLHRERRTYYGKDGARPLPQKLVLETEVREIWGDAQVWSWFRYPSVAPNAIASALMALEYWLSSDILKKNVNPTSIFNYYMNNTYSSSIIAVLSAVATKYPEQCADLIFPVLCCPGFWMMDQQRYLKDIIEAEDSIAIFSALDFDQSGWNWLKRDAQDKSRQWYLEGLALRLMLNDTMYQTKLLPIIRSFPMHLPYTDERQIDNEVVEAELRQTCEFMVLRTDVANFTLRDMGNGTATFEPGAISEHLVKVQEETEVKAAQIKEMTKLKQWANNVLNSKTVEDHLTPEIVFATIQHLASIPVQDTEDSFLAMERQATIASVAAALVHSADAAPLLAQECLSWCRMQLLHVFEGVNFSLDNIHSYYVLVALEAAAHALPHLLIRQPDDVELREALAVLLISPIEKVRIRIYAVLKLLWKTMPDFVWNCISLGVSIATRQQSSSGVPDANSPSWLKTEIERRIIKPKADIAPITLSEKLFLKIDWTSLECATYALPDRYTTLSDDWQEKLIFLYEDLFHFLLAFHQQFETAPMFRDKLNAADKWIRLFFGSLTRQIVFMQDEEAMKRFINPILAIWEQIPDVMEDFLRALLIAGSEYNPPLKSFATLWQHIGKVMLSNEMFQDHHSSYQSGILNALAILVFADTYTTWHSETWQPLDAFVELIEQWCITVGHIPSCFHALIRLLRTIGFPLFASKGVEWIALCIRKTASQPNGVDLLTESVVPSLAELLMRAYKEQKDMLLKSEAIWRKFNSIIDHLVSIGNPVAVNLHQHIQAEQAKYR